MINKSESFLKFNSDTQVGSYQPGEFSDEQELKDKIAEIRKLNIDIIDQAEVILILLDLKPATEIYLGQSNGSLEDIEKVFNQVGLETNLIQITELTEETPDHIRERYLYSLAISKDVKNVKKLAELRNAGENKENDLEYGRLMGFPETAIQAYIRGERPDYKFQNEYFKSNNLIFSFGLSRDYFEEEVKVIELWSRAIRHYAPDLAERIFNEKVNIQI